MAAKFISFEWFPFLTAFILHARISWSIRLRWLAITGCFLASLVFRYLLNLELPYNTIWWLLLILSVINLIYYAILKLFKKFSFTSELIIMLVHIIVDLIFLTLILHYSGGIENPVYFFYVFHVVMSSIIFPGIIPLLIATFVVFLFGLLVYLEYNELIFHYCIFDTGIHENVLLIALIMFVFTITVYVSTYICITFMQIFRNIKRQIDTQNRKLMDLDRQKTQFFLFSSHELKSPIIAIKSSIDGVIQSFGKNIDPRGLDVLQRASRRAEQMLLILKELIDLSRNRVALVEEKENPINIMQILRDVIQEDRVHAESKNQQIVMHLPDMEALIEGEVEDFRKVFTNLLSNAIRYTPDNGKITISARKEEEWVIIDIKDTGIGIPEEDQSKIFNEFYRSENAKKMINFGTGLGLSLVQQIIRNYRGDIKVTSEIDKGSTFTIYLPADQKRGVK